MTYKNKMASYEKNIFFGTDSDGQKRYQVRVKDKFGRWFPQQTYGTLDEARAYRNRLLCQRDAGGVVDTGPKRTMPTVHEYWERWSVEYRTKVSGGWRKSQDQMARDHVLPYWGGRKLDSIKSRDVGQLMRQLTEKGLGNQMQLHVFNLLSGMFRDAADKEEYGLLTETPISKKHRPAVQQKKEGLVLTPDESFALLRASREDPLGPAVWLALLAGLRAEAIHALKWNAVDFGKGQLLVKEAYERKEKLIQPYPKGKKWEYVPMPPVLAEYLRELKQGRHAFEGSFVAEGKPGQMLPYEVLYKGVKRLCETAGVPVVSTHRLRHSYTELAMAYGGANMEDVRRLLHHKSALTTQRYIHGGDIRLREVAQGMSDKIAAKL